MYPATGNANVNATSLPVPTESPMQRHANAIHDNATRLVDLNGRLANIIDRISGPQPEKTAPSQGEQASPPGILLVAQFGNERIRLGLDRFHELLNRLDQIV